MSRKIRLFSNLKFEQQTDIRDGLTYGVFNIKKVEYKGKVWNAVLYQDLDNEFLVVLDSIKVEDYEDDNFDFDLN